jgi:hypothetical protein
MLKYPDWQQTKNHQRCLYLLSLGEDIVIPYTRRDESGNVNKHSYRAKRTMGVPCKQPAFPTTARKDRRRWLGRCYICPIAKHRKRLEILSLLRMGVQGPFYQDNSKNM